MKEHAPLLVTLGGILVTGLVGRYPEHKDTVYAIAAMVSSFVFKHSKSQQTKAGS